MEMRVLGPFEFERDGALIRFARRQQRLILGILAVDANSIVSTDRLMDLIWGDRPPRQARAILQSRTSEVRALVNDGRGTSRLESATYGYRLRTPPDGVDVLLFTRLVDSAENVADEVAVGHLREALRLWRGPVLGSDATLTTRVAMCEHLEQRRLSAAERLFDLELRAGNGNAIIDDLTVLAGEHPGRERLVGLLIRALYTSGRNADALRVYERWRRSLADELGTDPSPELQDLHRDILRSQTAVTIGGPHAESRDNGNGFVPAVPRLLPLDILDFTGRRSEVATLVDLIRPRDRDHASVVAIAGLGGVGKTALAVHVAHRLTTQFPDGQLYIDLHGFDLAEPIPPAEALGRFLRAFGVDGGVIPDGLDERAELFRDLVADRAVLVLLDNATTADHVLPLVPTGHRCATVITSRIQIGPLIGATTLDLDVLSDQDATQLLGCLAGNDRVRADPQSIAELCQRSSNLPLALRIMGAKLAAKPHWTPARLLEYLRVEGAGLDQFAIGHLDVRATLSLTYKGLTAPAQRLLRLLHDVVATEISPWHAAMMAETNPAEAEELLEQLVDAQLLNPTGIDLIGQSRFRQHELIRLFAAEQAKAEPHDQRDGRDRSYRAWLTLADAACAGVYDGAHLSVRGTTPRQVVDAHVAALAQLRPLEWFAAERAGVVATVKQAARHDDVVPCWELATVTAPLFEIQRLFDDWHTVLAVALDAVRKNDDVLGRAAVQHQIGKLHASFQRPRDALRCFIDAQEILSNRPDQVLGWAAATAYVAMAQRFLGDTDAAEGNYRRALVSFAGADDQAGMAFALRGIGQIVLDRSDLDAADDYLGRALGACRVAGLRRLGAQCSFWLGTLRIKQDKLDEAEAIFAEVLSAMRALGDRTGEGQGLRGLAMVYRAVGRREDARSMLLKVLEIARQPRPTLLESAVRLDLSSL